MSKILNLTNIREILSDDEKEIQEIVHMLEQAIPEFKIKVKTFEGERNTEQLKFTIHKFKSSCQLITEPAFIELLRSIEKATPFSFEEKADDLEKMLEDCDLLLKEIHEYQSQS